VEPVRTETATGSRGGGALYLFGAAALLVALSLLVWIWRVSAQKEERLAAAVTPAANPRPALAGESEPEEEPTAIPVPTAAPTPEALPTPGPSGAADAIVGATRLERTAAPTRPRPATARAEATPAPRPTEAPPAPVLEASAASSAAPADNVYRTRRFAKFSSSPDQARLYVDGHYAGIVDDWDDRGGGKTLPFSGEGTHRVRMELPGYRTVHLDILVTSNADDDTVEIEDELKRQSRVEYPKLKGPFGRTVGPVEFQVVPADALVSEAGRTLGTASSLGPASPLRLSGPSVHDLVLSAPGYESRTIRILVSPNADRERAAVKTELKALPKP
jgi:hypothetical protein